MGGLIVLSGTVDPLGSNELILIKGGVLRALELAFEAVFLGVGDDTLTSGEIKWDELQQQSHLKAFFPECSAIVYQYNWNCFRGTQE